MPTREQLDRLLERDPDYYKHFYQYTLSLYPNHNKHKYQWEKEHYPDKSKRIRQYCLEHYPDFDKKQYQWMVKTYGHDKINAYHRNWKLRKKIFGMFKK